MTKDKIDRINELAHLAKERELTEAELNERTALRKEYIEEFRRGTIELLENTYIQTPDGKKRVHDAVHDLLILAVHARLLEHLVDERGLAVVDVGDDGDIPQLIHIQNSLDCLSFSTQKEILASSGVFCKDFFGKSVQKNRPLPRSVFCACLATTCSGGRPAAPFP